MIIFLYGPDTYRSRKKLNEIITKYQSKHKSGLNLRRLNFREHDFSDLKEAVLISPMFKEKKIIIIEGCFEKSGVRLKDLAQYLKESRYSENPDITLVFYEEKSPDRRNELYKFLTRKPHYHQEFNLLSGIRLESWLKKEIEQRGGKIQTLAVRKLAGATNGDLWQASQEIEKLILYKDQSLIEEKDIDLLTQAKIEANIFQTIDALAQRNKRLALKLFHQHLAEGANEQYLLAMFVYQFRNLLMLKSLIESGVSYAVLAKKTKLYPFVIEKTVPQLKNFSLEELRKIYKKLLEMDIATKSGKIEAKAALEIFLMAV